MTHMSLSGLRPGLPFTPYQYKKHLQAPPSRPSPYSQIHQSGSQPVTQTRKILPMGSSLPSLSEVQPQTNSPPSGMQIIQAEQWALIPWVHNQRHVILSMVTAAILNLHHQSSRKATHFVLRALNLQNETVCRELLQEGTGAPPIPNQIPLHITTIFNRLHLEPILEIYVCCPECFYLVALEKDVTQADVTCLRHLRPFDLEPACTSPLVLQKSYKSGPKETFTAIKPFIYQPFHNWLARFLNLEGIEEALTQHLHNPPKDFMTDIWDGSMWKKFKGNVENEPFLIKEGNLAFSLYIDWFNAFGKSSRHASLGNICLVCLNLPPELRLKPENIYLAAIIPGPKEPTGPQLNLILSPLIKELKDLWKGVYFSQTYKYPQGAVFRVAILTVIADVVAMRKITGFISHSGSKFCNFCMIDKSDIDETEAFQWPSRNIHDHKNQVAGWLHADQRRRNALFTEYGVRYSILEELPYWDATIMSNLDVMHNMILGALKDHAMTKLCLPESSWTKLRKNPIKLPSEDSSEDDQDDPDSGISDMDIDSREVRYLTREAQQDTRNLPARTNPIPVQQTFDAPSSIFSDLDYVPVSNLDDPSSSYSETQSQDSAPFKFDSILLGQLQDIIKMIDIPSDWTRVPKNLGAASHGSLKAAEWLLLYKLYIPIFMISKEYQNEPLSDIIVDNTFHLISSLNISTSWTISSQSSLDFTRHWTKYRQSCRKMYPDQRSKPNQHLSTHIPELLHRWGPAPSSATWAYERLNGLFSNFGTNNKTGRSKEIYNTNNYNQKKEEN